MRPIRTVLLCSLFAFGTTDAFAACDSIDEYTDMFAWQVSESNGLVRIEADGTAEGHGDNCGNFYIEVSLLDPSDDVRHMRTDTGWGFASQTAYVETDEPEEVGEWSAQLMTWENGNYIGCGSAYAQLGLRKTFFKNPSGSPPKCTYTQTACCLGTSPWCTAGAGLVLSFSPGCPSVVRVDYITFQGECFNLPGVDWPYPCGDCE